jgi:hypothetical protein
MDLFVKLNSPDKKSRKDVVKLGVIQKLGLLFIGFLNPYFCLEKLFYKINKNKLELDVLSPGTYFLCQKL